MKGNFANALDKLCTWVGVGKAASCHIIGLKLTTENYIHHFRNNWKILKFNFVFNFETHCIVYKNCKSLMSVTVNFKK